MRGFLEYLTPLYTASSSSSVLHDATHAVALFAFGAYPGRENLRQEAGVLYGQALQKVSAALKDPAKATADETLLAVMLFSLYEVCVEQLPIPSTRRGCKSLTMIFRPSLPPEDQIQPGTTM